MGQCSSRSKNRQNSVVQNGNNVAEVDSVLVVDSANKYDDDMVSLLKRELNETPEVFILNNLLMSVMFFENYEKEINKVANLTTKHEKELNLKLINEECKQCIMPDVVLDIVHKHVRFRPLHGPKKHISQPLVPQRLYVVHDNVEVLEPDDSADYSGIDKPNYRVRMETSNKAGFVKLREIEHLNTASSSSDTRTPSTTSSIEERHVDGIYDGPSTSTGIQSNYSSDSYEYVTITRTKTPQPIQIDVKDLGKKKVSFPNKCFTIIKVKHIELDEPESDDEERKKPPILFDDVTYINSKGFMEHFASTVFPNTLGNALGFDDDTIKSATIIPGTIFCNSYDTMGNVLQRHVIPAVDIQWPAIVAFEWAMREDRPTIVDKRTTFRYKWPTDNMIYEIKRLHCVVIPRGFIPKRGENKISDVEWEVAFPKAERFIDTKMSHAQTRCFLFLMAIHKTFIEPVTGNHGVLMEHIRNHMYWECEANYPNWPENRLGKKLMIVMKRLYDKLGSRQLSNYFVRDKNLLQNIPVKYLVPAQRLLHQVMQAPVMYFLVALRNLRYMSGKFYPPLDFKKLHAILVQEGARMGNPAIYDLVKNDRKVVKKRTDDAETQWKMRYHEEQWNKKKKVEEEKIKEENLTDKIKSTDSVDLQWHFDSSDVFKKITMLTFFIEHFFEMGKKSKQLSTARQSLLYLKQAWYLSKLLEDTDKQGALDWQQKIREEEELVKRLAAQEESAPVIPKRNSAFIQNGDAIQHVKGNAIHLSNLNTTNNIKLQSKLKRNQSNREVKVEIHDEQIRGGHNDNRRKTISFQAEIDSISEL